MSDFLTAADDLSAFGRIVTEAPMHEYTTFKTGGKADVLVHPSSIESASSIVKYALTRSIPLTVIGGGSNLVIGDKGIRGIVIRMAEDDITRGTISDSGDGFLYADAIVKKRDFISAAAECGYSQIEFMVGIPGCIGGGIMMNAGTFMGNFAGVLDSIRYIDRKGEIGEIRIHHDMASYRGLDLKDPLIVWGGNFSFNEIKTRKEIENRIQEIIDDRKMKHPQDPSAGSVFKNPEGFASWKLVNDSGLRGKKIGGAMVSDLHTNFIINSGGATSKDVRCLIEYVQAKVLETFGVELHTEVKMIGEF